LVYWTFHVVEKHFVLKLRCQIKSGHFQELSPNF